MGDSNVNFNAAENAILLLKDFRERRAAFQAFDEYDKAMSQMRTNATEKIDKLEEPLKSIAFRLFSIADKGFFLFQVCEWKIDYLCEALIHAIEAKNPISLANNARALVEHLATLVAIAKELEKLQERLRGQGQEKAIFKAIETAETFIYRAYYGKSPKVATESNEQALHVNDCLKTLKEEVSDIEDVYDFLCEYVHPNHGSNALVSTGQLASGRLNPPEAYHRETLDRLRRYCTLCMLFLRDRGVEHGTIFVKINNLFELCCARGAKISNVFSIKAPNPDGNGKSKETAYFFRKARTAFEAMSLCYEFLEKEGYEVRGRQSGGFGHGVIYDIYNTDKGKVWFKVPTIQS
ncbi:hypothetical protein SAMN04487957_1145 [Halomonas shengliensis]|uniref:Uncharacterized protein n=1 Tax=Halomonas shengliensis TaxID=419597 RepID=A0A1H0N354_9GAMM|nr:hypothetical protein [Halomonas shengliensis]SDO86800.1 hypothetical protein SAMN04487957_1145 [Halomonas shengliensis]